MYQLNGQWTCRQWDGTNYWTIRDSFPSITIDRNEDLLYIPETLTGTGLAGTGDWIVYNPSIGCLVMDNDRFRKSFTGARQ